MSQDKQKQYETEWSFSFDKLATNLTDSVGRLLGSIGVTGEDVTKTDSFSEPVGDAVSAKVRLDLSVGAASVTTLPVGALNLIEADVTYVGEVEFSTHIAGTHKVIRLGQTSQGVFGTPGDILNRARGAFEHRTDLRWDVRLSRDVSLELEINTGVTEDTIDLTGLRLSSLKVNSGTGKTHLILPNTGANYAVHINSGTGEFSLSIEAGADIDLKFINGVGSGTLTIGEGTALDAEITGGIGSIAVLISDGAAARVKSASGLGNVTVPGYFVKLRGNDDFLGSNGTWETAGFDAAPEKINIDYKGGIGNLTVR